MYSTRQEDGNNTTVDHDDATWVLTNAFTIFTMQSGFGLLESGMASMKNEANIMVKNAVDVIFGGFSYWVFGFAFSFGIFDRGNPFCGLGYFLTDAEESSIGQVYSQYFFQLSFATTATTIVSGAMAERIKLKAYILYSFLNTLTYSFPAHWIWDENGFLHTMGAVDIAGCSAVQCSAFGWRSKRFGCDDDAKATKRTIRQECSSQTNGFTDKCALRDFHAVVGMVGLQLRKYIWDNWHEMETCLKVFSRLFSFFILLPQRYCPNFNAHSVLVGIFTHPPLLHDKLWGGGGVGWSFRP